MPSTAGGGWLGTLLANMALLPRCRRMPRRDQAWWQASASSCPVCLARATATFFTSLCALSCQPPKDSTARGRKAIPCLWQSSSAPLTLKVMQTRRECRVVMLQLSVSHDLDSPLQKERIPTYDPVQCAC